MGIKEAVGKAIEIGLGGVIYRKSCLYEETCRRAYIKPTNSYDCCQLLVFDENKKVVSGSRNWNPTADDLVADDWEILKV